MFVSWSIEIRLGVDPNNWEALRFWVRMGYDPCHGGSLEALRAVRTARHKLVLRADLAAGHRCIHPVHAFRKLPRLRDTRGAEVNDERVPVQPFAPLALLYVLAVALIVEQAHRLLGPADEAVAAEAEEGADDGVVTPLLGRGAAEG